jgi:phosphoglycolate phosphatase
MRAVFFDLDGTLADTAPDLGCALNRMREARGLAALSPEHLRPVSSAGARGLLGAGFGIKPGDPDYEAMVAEFLANYAENLCRETRLFPGMAELLEALDRRSVLWGIVTNKAERFARPLLEFLKVAHRAACIIGGDTTPHIKPHPAPLLAASVKTGIPAIQCVYVGDDQRDVQAAIAASMKPVVVSFGYLYGSDPKTWGADAIIDAPLDLLPLLA